MCAVTASFQHIRCCDTRRAGTSEDLLIVRDLVHFEEDLEEDDVGVNTDTLTRVRRAVWGMLYADDAAVVSKSAEGLANMMMVIVTVFEAAGSRCP